MAFEITTGVWQIGSHCMRKYYVSVPTNAHRQSFFVTPTIHAFARRRRQMVRLMCAFCPRVPPHPSEQWHARQRASSSFWIRSSLEYVYTYIWMSYIGTLHNIVWFACFRTSPTIRLYSVSSEQKINQNNNT